MLMLLGALALTLQVQTPRSRPAPIVRDSAGQPDTVSKRRRRPRGTREPVTAEVLTSAFKDQVARSTLLQARVARLRQDSALKAYDAMSYQRVSAGMGFSRIGRDRLLFRHESAARIRWQDGVGVWIDVKGDRSAVPMVGPKEMREEIESEANDPDFKAAIPYYPGYEPLWVGGSMARAQVDESEIVNPIADGAEAYYTYEAGDSVSFRLPDGKTIRLRELKVRPRKPKWNLAVGSLWFDTQSGQLVRAAYRLSVPIDIWEVAKADDPKADEDIPVWVKPMIMPMRAQISAIAVEYGLHEGRFWLPRLRMAEGDAQVSFMHVPVKLEESFRYASVNGKDSLPAIKVGGPRNPRLDSLSAEELAAYRDSVRLATRARVRAENDSIRAGLKKRAPRVNVCDTAEVRTTTSNRYDQTLKVAMRVPCDVSKLENSPDLPASIYDPGEELFGTRELEALRSEALSLSAQAPLQFRLQAGMLPPPVIAYGPSMLRYNRVEGLSAGISVEQQFGGGYSGLAIGRFGLADREPNVELTVTRTNLLDAIHVAGYNRLVSASDWGRPLSFGSSFSALMFGRDEGFYYRASGAEIGGGREAGFGGGTRIEWRGFMERQRNAAVRTNFAVNGADFPANLVARRATFVGLGTRLSNSRGLDPQGLRVFSDLRLEVANADSLYGRGAMDLTLTHGLGQVAAALTLSGGSSVGGVPPQRLWYLGGSQTVRGQSPDPLQSGNAFWLTRMELGSNDVGMRPTLFGDIGWVGDRDRVGEVGRPMSGVGAGVSFMDGLFRFDVARGLYPRKQFRVDLYLEAKF
jgi:hypothetical protein